MYFRMIYDRKPALPVVTGRAGTIEFYSKGMKRILERELQTGLHLMEVFIVGQEVAVEMVIGVVEHHLGKLIESIVDTDRSR